MIRALSTVVAVLAALVVPVVTAPAAAAAVTGVVVVTASTAPSSATTQTVTAWCPAGKVVIGSTGWTWGAPHDTVMTAIVPGTSNVPVSAREDQDGTTATWGITARAVCADPIPGRVVVSTASPTNSLNKQVFAVCPAGTLLLGHGHTMNGTYGQVFLNGASPHVDLTRVSYTGMEDQDGLAGSWSVTAHAVCAPAQPGVFLITATSASNSDDKHVVANCGLDRQWLSLGWSFLGIGGGTPGGQVIAGHSASGTGWVALHGAEDDDGYAGVWQATVRVLCGPR